MTGYVQAMNPFGVVPAWLILPPASACWQECLQGSQGRGREQQRATLPVCTRHKAHRAFISGGKKAGEYVPVRLLGVPVRGRRHDGFIGCRCVVRTVPKFRTPNGVLFGAYLDRKVTFDCTHVDCSAFSGTGCTWQCARTEDRRKEGSGYPGKRLLVVRPQYSP